MGVIKIFKTMQKKYLKASHHTEKKSASIVGTHRSHVPMGTVHTHDCPQVMSQVASEFDGHGCPSLCTSTLVSPCPLRLS